MLVADGVVVGVEQNPITGMESSVGAGPAFQNEGLDPFINRTYNIMSRANLLPEPPSNIADAELEIQYVSMLNFAQSAVGVIPTERFLGLIGNVAALYPKAVNIPNWDDLLRYYSRDIGVSANGVNSRDETEALGAQQDEAEAGDKAMAMAQPGADAAKLLSETQVGGGSDALSMLMGA
jgi:hypothetical protein